MKRALPVLPQRGADLHEAAADAVDRPAAEAGLRDLQGQHDRLVGGRAEIERGGEGAGKPVDQAAVEAKGHHIAAEVGGLARPHVVEAWDRRWSYGVVVADNGR